MANHKLSFHTPSSLRWDPPGSATPPPQKPGSVPFLWEEKPGMPKKNTSLFKPFSDVTPADSTGPLSVQSLELPPRLVAKMKAMQMQRHVDLVSPTMVLDEPGLANPGPTRVHVTCHSFSYYREDKKKAKRQTEAWFWPKRKNPRSKKLGEELMMPTPKLSRNRSLTSVSDSHHSSHFWVCFQSYIYFILFFTFSSCSNGRVLLISP